jgi:hypothetical protein
MKLWLKCLISCIPFLAFSQPRIDDVGDGWKGKVEQALQVIQQTDCEKYEMIMSTCTHISYSTANFATTESGNTILIPRREIVVGNINDIAAILVHESLHLYILKTKMMMPPADEELLCYAYELEFLLQIPGVETWLLDHARKQIAYFSSKTVGNN